jgi:hypothetical protein
MRVVLGDTPIGNDVLFTTDCPSYRACDDGKAYPVLKLELAAGREGDDSYVAITPDNPQFDDLLEVMTTAESAATT